MALENYSEPARIGLTFAFAVIIVTDLIGNSLVCHVVFKHNSMRIPMNYLLVNLAVSDILVAVFIAPRYLFSQVFQHPSGATGNILCKLITGEIFTWVGALSSVFTLVCIAIERYVAVTYPYNDNKRLTRHRLLYIIPAGWLFALSGNIPLFLYVTYVEEFGACLPIWPTGDFAKYHSVIGAFFYGGFPMLIMGILYSRIITQLWFKQDTTSTIAQQAVLKYRRRSTKMVAIVSLIYCLCWIPDFVVYIFVAFSSRPLYNEIHTTAVLLVTLNSAINPIIYSFQSERFHKHLVGLLCCRRRRIAVQPSGTGDSHNTGDQTLSTL